MSWSDAINNQYRNIRTALVSNYQNNMNVVMNRTVPAALDYPNAAQEVANSKAAIQSVIETIAAEADNLNVYLKDLNEKLGPQMAEEIQNKESHLRKLEHENTKYREIAETRKAQSEDIYNKYEGNNHSQPFIYAPWEVASSKWYSYTVDNPYINLNPSARSGILFIAFFLGLAAIIILGSKLAASYDKLPTFTGFSSMGSSLSGLFTSTSNPSPFAKPGLVRKF
jgi:hypothetical protein